MTNRFGMIPTRTRTAFGAAVALAASFVAVAVASPAPTIVVSGSRSASTVVTFPRRVTVFYGDPAYGERGPQITGRDPAGFVLARLDGQVVAGSVATTQASMDGQRELVPIGDGIQVTLPAGRYRLTLVASGPTQVRIPVEGLRATVTYRPANVVTVRSMDVPFVSTADLTLPVSPSATGRVTATLGARTVLVGAFRHRATGNGETVNFCVTPVGGGCPDGAVYVQWSDSTLGGPPQVARPTGQASVVVPGLIPPGRFDIAWTVETKGLGSEEHAKLIAIG